MENLEQPKIDIAKIQESANKGAEKAYLKEVENYYTGYDSPYRKMIKAELEKQEFSFGIKLPDLIAKVNDGLKAEVDKIANLAVANTYISQVSKVLLRIDKEMKLSELLKMIITDEEPDPEDFETYSFSLKKDEGYEWLSCELTTMSGSYSFTFHKKSRVISKNSKLYHLLSYPNITGLHDRTMKVSKDDITIEMPFAGNILEDKVMAIFARMMLSDAYIEIDCDGFDYSMFPENEYDY